MLPSSSKMAALKFFFVAFLCCLHFASLEESKEKEDTTGPKISGDEIDLIKEKNEICSREHKVQVDPFSDVILPPERNIQCYLKCMMQNLGAMKDNGEVILEGVNEIMEKFKVTQNVTDAVTSCIKDVRIEEACAGAYTLYVCVYGKIGK